MLTKPFSIVHNIAPGLTHSLTVNATCIGAAMMWAAEYSNLLGVPVDVVNYRGHRQTITPNRVVPCVTVAR